MSGEDFVLSEDDSQKELLRFEFGTDSESNISFERPDWSKINRTPFAFLNKNLFDWDITSLIVKRFFMGDGAINPGKGLGDTIVENETLKVTDNISLGRTSDLIALFAQKNRVNPIQVRNYVVSSLSLLEYLRKSGLAEFPIDIDFGVSKDCFFIQMNCPFEDIFLENLLEATKTSSVKSPFVSLLQEALGKTDLLEIYTLASTKKFVLSASWIRNPVYIGGDHSPSLMIHQIDSFSNSISATSENEAKIKSYIEPSTNINKNARFIEDLPTAFQGLQSRGAKINPILIKRVVRFILDFHSDEEINLEQYDHSQLKLDLSAFHDKEALTSILDEEKDEIIRLIVSGGDLEDFEDQSRLVKGSIDSDEYLASIVESVSNMTVEAARVAAGVPEDEDEAEWINGKRDDSLSAITVKGSSDSEAEAVETIKGERDVSHSAITVKGSSGSEAEAVETIKGVTEKIDDELWKVKRSNVAEKVKGRINDLRNAGLSNEEIDKEVKTIIMAEMNLDDKAGDHFVESLGDDIADAYVRKEQKDNSEEIKQRVKVEKMERQLEVRGDQVQRMKKVIEGLSRELSQLKLLGSETVKNQEPNQVIQKEDLVNDLVDDCQNDEWGKEANLALKREVEKISNENEALIKSNEILLRKFKESTSKPNESESEEGLEAENNKLRTQVEGLKKKVSFMYENSKLAKQSSFDANEIQKIVDDKERYFSEKMKLKKDYESSKAEVRELERKVTSLKLENGSSQKNAISEGSITQQAELAAKEKELEELKVQLREVQVDGRAHELKAKSYEQKVKFLNAQLEKFQKQQGHHSQKKRAPSVVDNRMAERLKQMELVGGRLKMGNEKLSKELAEKKTEAHKAQLEAKTLAMKLKSLERKLAGLSKKKAA